MEKSTKTPRQLKSLEIFEHEIEGRKIIVAFKLDGEIGNGLSEASISIKHPEDEYDEKFGIGLVLERLSQKDDKVHYGVLTDAEILDWAAKGMAYEAANRIADREFDEDFTTIMEKISEQIGIDVEQIEKDFDLLSNEQMSNLADTMAFFTSFPTFNMETLVKALYPGFPYTDDCKDCPYLGECITEFKKENTK